MLPPCKNRHPCMVAQIELKNYKPAPPPPPAD